MANRMNESLDQLKQTIRASGVVRADAVELLKEELSGAGPIGRDQADLLLDINAAVSGTENDPSWQEFFVESLTAHLLGGPSFSNVLDDDKAGYLLSKLKGDGKLGDAELELLVNICSEAASVPDRFLDYVLSAIGLAVVEDAAITQARVELIRRVVYARGSAGDKGIDRKMADFLFDLNDAMTGRPNHASWTELFVEAVSDHVLQDEQSPGEVDTSETEWLVNRIEADQQYDETEKALLAKIKYSISYDEVWGGIRSDDLQASTRGVVASLYSRACDGGKGGDIYYFSVSASDMLTRIAVADVSGHGQAVTDLSQWIYNSLAARMNNAEGHEVLADLNRLAFGRGYKAMTTAAVVTFYRADSNLYFANAGHPPMFLRRTSDDRWHRVALDDRPEAANLPLGVDPEMQYDQQQIPLAQGDRLFLYTDGLVEAQDANRQLFGASRLEVALETAAGGTPKDVKDAVLASLWQHTGGRLTHDDVTFMVVEVR